MLRTDLTDETTAVGVHPDQHNEANQAILDLQGGGGGPIVRKFPFAFDTPDLLTGHSVYTPTIGDVLLFAWVQIDTAWNGTTPKGDCGDAVGGGFFANSYGGVLPMTALDSPNGLLSENGSLGALFTSGLFGATRLVPGRFMTTGPLLVWVSSDGTRGGPNPGSSQGAAVLYLVTATPV